MAQYPVKARKLSEQEMRQLINAGIPSDEVLAYQNGTATINTQAKANVILANGGVFKTPGSWAGSQSTPDWGSFGDALSGIDPVSSFINSLGSIGRTGGRGTPQGGGGRTSGGSGTFTLDTPPSGGGIFGSTIPQSPATQPPPARSRTNSSLGAPKKGGGSASTNTGGVPMPTTQGLPDFPSMGPYTVPVITPRDFMDKATELTDQAFQPLFDSLNASKENIGTQGVRTQQIVGGLYDNLRTDIAEQAAKTATEYKGRQDETQQTGEVLGKQIGSNYQAANADTASTLASLGLGAAAPDVTAQNTADQAWQQGQAATNTQAQGAYYGQQAQGQADYDAQLGNIASNQGAVAQGDVANQVSQMLAGVDQNIASNQADKGQLALSIANQLTQQDLSAQESNAGFSMHGQDADRQAKLDAYQAAAQSALTNNQISQQTYENITRQIQQEFENTRNINNDVLNQQNWERTFGQNQAELELSTLPGGSNSSDSSSDGGLKPTGPFASRTQAEQAVPGKGGSMYDTAVQLAQDYGPNSGKTLSDFMERLRYEAVQHPERGFDQNLYAQIGQFAFNDLWGVAQANPSGSGG